MTLAVVHASATAVWPPAGIALAALLLLGYRVWPGIFLGAFLANIATAGSTATSIGIATGNTLEGLVGAYLVTRFAHGSNAFDRAQEVFRFAVAGMLSTTVSATLGVTSLALGGYARWVDYGEIWFTWWLGDVSGALIVAPLVILWSLNPRIRWNQKQMFEAGLLILSLVVVSLIVFGGWLPTKYQNYPVAFLILPILVWAASRFGQRETATATFLIAGFAIWGGLRGFGPFLTASPNESLLLLGAFTGVAAVTGMALAASVAERRRVEEGTRRLNEELDLRVIEGMLAELNLRSRLQQQAVVADLGLSALTRANLDELMNEAVALVVEVLENEFGEVLELLPGGKSLLLRAGVGWKEGSVGRATVGAERDSHAGYTLLSREPVIVEDLRTETRFSAPRLLHEHGVVSGISVVIPGKDRVYGALCTHTAEKRTFTRDDAHFLQAVANLLGVAIERKRAEDQLQRYAAELEAFSYSLAHDLRSPVLSVEGLSQILMKDYGERMDAGGLDLLRLVIGHAGRMDALIRDILTYRKLDRVDLNHERLSLSALLDNVLGHLDGEIQRSRARIDVRGPLPAIVSDRVLLTQILSNLVANAIKFVEPGVPPEIEVWAEVTEQGVRLYVKDNGIGMAPEHHESIFRVFERLHGPDTYSGTGIGLAIVAKGVEYLGGRKGVESEPGKGSRFWIELPMASAITDSSS